MKDARWYLAQLIADAVGSDLYKASTDTTAYLDMAQAAIDKMSPDDMAELARKYNANDNDMARFKVSQDNAREQFNATIAAAKERYEAVERACEMSLTDAQQRGVLVETWPNGSFSVLLSDQVPYGNIHWVEMVEGKPEANPDEAGSAKIAYLSKDGIETTAYVTISHGVATGTNKYSDEPMKAEWNQAMEKWVEVDNA